MWLDDKSMPTNSQLAQYGYDGFLSGISAMGVSGHWSVPDYAAAGFNLDVAPLPKGPAGRATGVNSAGFVISPRRKNPDAAWAFVKFADGRGRADANCRRSGFAVPIRESVAESDAYLKQARRSITRCSSMPWPMPARSRSSGAMRTGRARWATP